MCTLYPFMLLQSVLAPNCTPLGREGSDTCEDGALEGEKGWSPFSELHDYISLIVCSRTDVCVWTHPFCIAIGWVLIVRIY